MDNVEATAYFGMQNDPPNELKKTSPQKMAEVARRMAPIIKNQNLRESDKREAVKKILADLRIEEEETRRDYRDNELPFSAFDDLLPRISSVLDAANHVKISEEGHEFFRRLREEIRIRAGETTIGSTDFEPMFDGILLDSGAVEECAHVFADIVASGIERGYAEKDFAGAAEVLRNIRKSAALHSGSAILYVFPDTLQDLLKKQALLINTLEG